MKNIFILIFLLQTIVFYGQVFGQESETKYITISSRVLDGHFKREVKIDLKSGEVYARSNTSKKYKPKTFTPNDTIVKFLRDSLNYDYLKSIIKEAAFDEVGYKIEFVNKNCSILYPCFTEIQSIEFGSPHDQNNLRLQKIINLYYEIRTKAKI